MTSRDLLKIHDQLEIDRNCFFDLGQVERSIIFQWSLAFKTETFETNDQGQLMLDQQLFKDIARKIKFRFKYHHEQTEIKLDSKWEQLFNVGYRAWQIDGQAIFASIQPFERQRLEEVLINAGKMFDENRIRAGCQMAEIMKCKDVYEFVAVFEFTVRKLKSRRDIDFQNFENNQDKQNEIKDSFRELIEDTQELYDPSDKKLSFANAFVAANHFDKHRRDWHKDKILTPTEYIEKARKLASSKATTIEMTQDGSALKCQFETDEAIAVCYVRNDKSVIATLHKNKHKRQINQ